MINSRPITYASENNRDPAPLSPLMFLKELPTCGVPDIDAPNCENLNRRAKYRQRIRNDRRNSFQTEYLGQRRQYANNKKDPRQIQMEDIVFLEETTNGAYVVL